MHRKFNAKEVTIVYKPDSEGEYHIQNLEDIIYFGTLIDPWDGDELEISHVIVDEK